MTVSHSSSQFDNRDYRTIPRYLQDLAIPHSSFDPKAYTFRQALNWLLPQRTNHNQLG